MSKLMVLLSLLITCFIIPGDNISPYVIASFNPSLDQILLANPEGSKNKVFPEVIFTHKKHYVDHEITCLECHHNWKTDDRDNPQKCIECHKPKLDDTNRKFILLRNAYHRCCKDCHIDLRNREKPTGPVKCRECHILVEDRKG